MRKTLLQNIRDKEWRANLSIVEHTLLALAIGFIVVSILYLATVMWKLVAFLVIILAVGEAILYTFKQLDR